MRRAPLALILVIGAHAASAGAQTRQVQSHLALAQPTAPETLPAAVIRQVVFRIAEGLVESGLDVSVDPFPGGACTGAACLRDMARAHSSAAVVLTRISAEGQNYTVRIELVDGATGLPAGAVQRSCNFCAYDELGTTALETTRALLREQRERQRTPSLPLRLVHRDAGRETRMAWAAIGLGMAAVTAGVLLLAVEHDEPAARWPAVGTIAAGTMLAGGGATVLLFWPQSDARGRFVGAAATVHFPF